MRERKKKQQLGFAVHAALCQLLLNQELTGEQHEQKTFSTNRERDVKACLQCTDLKVGCGATRLQAVGCERDAERCLVVRRIKFDVLAVSQVFFFFGCQRYQQQYFFKYCRIVAACASAVWKPVKILEQTLDLTTLNLGASCVIICVAQGGNVVFKHQQLRSVICSYGMLLNVIS